MATIAKTFPGVYTQIIDQSFLTPARSSFKPGLIGVASKGPFNTPVPVRSLNEFVQQFGQPLTTTYAEQSTDFLNSNDTSNDLLNSLGEPVGPGYFLADAVAMIADMTDGITVVRVGNQYADLPTADVSGSSGAYTFLTGVTNATFIAAQLTAGNDVYLSISQQGKASTVNVAVQSAGTSGLITLESTGDALAADYQGATVVYSNYSGAAWEAEGVLYAYSYGTSASDYVDRPVTSVGAITGEKNQYYFDVTSNPGNVEVGGVYKIMETDQNTTSEVRVSQIVGNRVYLETSDITRVGYQAAPLQDNYTAGVLCKVNTALKIPFLYLEAKTAGEWANGSNQKTGLYVQVRPGSAAGTKKLEIFWNAALVETLDNISDTATASDDDSYESIIALSQYITLKYRFSYGGGQLYHAANTVAPWDATYYVYNAGPPLSMPQGAINAGILSLSVSSTVDTGGQFTQGYNGANAQIADFVGTVDPADDTASGIKAFEDTDNVDVNVLAAPMDDMPVEIMQELRRVAKKVNAIALADVPAGLNARQAIDWHNGSGLYVGRGRIDDPNIAVFWNWFTVVDPFTGLQKMVPPTLGALRCMAFTFDRDKPWFAAAGETRGLIPEAIAVEFERVADSVKQAMYGNGNSINPILKLRGRFMLYGERTLQRAESKLTAIHSVNLVNWTVTGLANIARRFVFDPNDQELLTQVRLSFSEFMDKIRNERGVEDYSLIVDERNNTAETRNRREVIVDLSLIPTDVAERIYINATVRESGAQLNSVS